MCGLRLAALALLSGALGLAPGRAELPPSTYVSDQKQAPESLTIKVLSVKVSRQLGTTPLANGTVVRTDCVKVTAEVVAVARSKSGRKKGDRITIEYDVVRGRYRNVGGRLVVDRGWDGPSDPPLLKQGEQVPAYLHYHKTGTFSLAARGWSFKTAED